MLHYKHKQHRHRGPQKIFHGWAKSIRAAADAMQMDVHRVLYPVCTTKKMSPMLRQQSQKCASFADVSFHIVWKCVTYCYQQSLSRCITCHRYLLSIVSCGKTLTPVTWSEPLLLCYCNEIKANFRTICSQVSQPASAGNVTDMSDCKLKSAWHHNSKPGSCAVWVSYRKIKLSLQELSQLSA